MISGIPGEPCPSGGLHDFRGHRRPLSARSAAPNRPPRLALEPILIRRVRWTRGPDGTFLLLASTGQSDAVADEGRRISVTLTVHGLVQQPRSCRLHPPAPAAVDRGSTRAGRCSRPPPGPRTRQRCFTVECDNPSRCAAAFSEPAARTAATTTSSRWVARAGARSLTPAASPQPATHPAPRSGSRRLLTRARHLSGAPERMFSFIALLRATRTPEAVHEFNDPSIERARELVAECVEVRHGERLVGDPV